MIASKYINASYPYLKTQDTVGKALELMQEYKVSHLPLVDEEENYLKLLSESFLEELQTDFTLDNIKIYQFRPFVYENQSIFDVLTMIYQQNISLLPVLKQDTEKYLGPIVVNDLVKKLIPEFGLDREGGVLVLNIKPINYSVVQIANIVEANNAKILSFFSVPEEEEIKLIIKVNVKDVFSLLETFERYGYEVEAVFQDDKRYQDFYKDIYDSLMNYLSI